MPKLHELLAVNSSLENQATGRITDQKELYTKKQNHFTARRVEFHSNEPNVPVQTEEKLDLQTSVNQELKWLSEFLIKAVDSSHQVNVGNLTAKADVIMEDNSILLKDVPATTLLELEKTVATWKDLLSVLPTLDPAKGFQVDTSIGPNVWKSRELTRPKTAKKNTPIVLYNATPEHPAQTQLVVEDVPIGKVITQEWSSMITPAEKADLLTRAEALIRAIKRARSRANEVDVDIGLGNRIGQKLWEYVIQPPDVVVADVGRSGMEKQSPQQK